MACLSSLLNNRRSEGIKFIPDFTANEKKFVPNFVYALPLVYILS